MATVVHFSSPAPSSDTRRAFSDGPSARRGAGALRGILPSLFSSPLRLSLPAALPPGLGVLSSTTLPWGCANPLMISSFLWAGRT